jgi:flagellin-like protein
MKNKRGLSPVVATVLLVALVLVLASIIFLWARGFLGEQIEKGGKPAMELCKEMKFDVELISTSTSGVYTVQIVNRGNYAIYNFLIMKELEGNRLRQDFTFSVGKQQSLEEQANLNLNGRVPETVTFYPAILGKDASSDSNKAYTCMENGVEKRLR